MTAFVGLAACTYDREDSGFPPEDGPGEFVLCDDGEHSTSLLLTSQAEVDEAAACRFVGLHLEISGDDIVDLTPLVGLETVEGSVSVHDAPALTSLAGLNVKRGSGRFSFSSLPIESLEPLVAFEEFSEDATEASLYLADNGIVSLAEAAPFFQKAEAAGLGVRLGFESMNRLADLDGVAGVTRLHDVTIRDTNALVDFTGLENVESVDDLRISQTSIVHVDFLPNLENARAVWLSENSLLQTVELPPGVQMEGLVVHDNPLVATLGPAITGLEWLVLTDCPALADIAGVMTADAIGGDGVRITNTGVTRLDTLAFSEVDGHLFVLNNRELPQADAEAWAEAITAKQKKIDGNLGWTGPHDPCPYVGDDVCDDETGTGLCVSDYDCD